MRGGSTDHRPELIEPELLSEADLPDWDRGSAVVRSGLARLER